MIEGKKISLIPFEEEHWVHFEKWLSDKKYKYYFRNMPEQYRRVQLANFPQLTNMNILMILEKESNEIIGFFSYDNIRLIARSCEMGFLIDRKYAGTGLPKDAWFTFLWYIFNRMGFHKVSAYISESEKEVCEKVEWGGFTFERTSRDNFYLDGKWNNDCVYSILDHEFRKRYNKYLNGEETWQAAKAEAI